MNIRLREPMRGLARFSALALLSLLACGCNSVGYYAQAVKGHWQIVSRQTSCGRILADTNTPTELRRKLELAQELCAFAEDELGLPANGTYRRYADLQRHFVVWNVYAAPEFSLEAKTWWYPFVGSLDYRGYFSERAARNYANRLETRGFDVYVEGVEAYSTLGWFNDPLLNTFLHHDEPILAEVLFHELAHQKVFLNGETDFNEAFATVVASAGVRRWLQAKGDDTMLEQYESALARNAKFIHIVQQTRKDLERLYEAASRGHIDPPVEVGKQQILDGLRQAYANLKEESLAYEAYAPWFTADLNNAKLNSTATYYDLVPAFDWLLAAHQNQLEPFYETVVGLTRLPEAERHAQLTKMGHTLAETR